MLTRQQKFMVVMGSKKADTIPWYLKGGIPLANCLEAHAPYQALSYAASLLDITGHGKSAYEGSAPGWSAEAGWIGDGIGKYLYAASVLQDIRSFVVWYTDHASGAPQICGGNGGSPSFYLMVSSDRTANQAVLQNRILPAGALTVSFTGAAAVMGVTPAAGYINGANVGAVAGSAAGSGGATKFGILCRVNGATPANFAALDIKRIALYDITLSDPQMLAIANAITNP